MSEVVLDRKGNSVWLKLPEGQEVIEVSWGKDIQVVWTGKHLQPSYHYRWEANDETDVGEGWDPAVSG